MSLFNVFNQKEKDKRKSHIKNLLEVAVADGILDDVELEIVMEVASKFDLTKAEVLEIKDEPSKIKFNPPSSEKAKIELLYDVVQVMIADKEIHENEVKLCKDLAVKLNLAPVVVDEIIKMVTDSISSASDKHNIEKLLDL